MSGLGGRTCWPVEYVNIVGYKGHRWYIYYSRILAERQHELSSYGQFKLNLSLRQRLQWITLATIKMDRVAISAVRDTIRLRPSGGLEDT